MGVENGIEGATLGSMVSSPQVATGSLLFCTNYEYTTDKNNNKLSKRKHCIVHVPSRKLYIPIRRIGCNVFISLTSFEKIFLYKVTWITSPRGLIEKETKYEQRKNLDTAQAHEINYLNTSSWECLC